MISTSYLRKYLGVLIILFSGTYAFSQTNYSTKDSVHIFWQPNVKLTNNDYQGSPDSKTEEILNKYGINVSASVGIWSVLDVPKKKKDRYKYFEKVYFAPAFDKTTSYTKTSDTLQIAMESIYFDMCEYWARMARQNLASLLDTMKDIGTISIWYMTVKNDIDKRRLNMFKNYFNDVYVNKTDSSFIQWKNLINKLLNQTEKWTTKPEECYRLMSKTPIEKNYIMAPNVVGDLSKDKKK